MPYYFKNSSIDNNFHSINLTKVANSGFNYKNASDATSAEYEASVTAVGEAYSTTYKPKNTISNAYFYAVVPTDNAINRVVFTVDQVGSNLSWCIYIISFKNIFSGKIHFKIQSITQGAGAGGAYSTVVDSDGTVEADRIRSAYMEGGHIPGYALVVNSAGGGMTGTRYAITITATSTSGEITTLNFPYVYCQETTDSYKNTAYEFYIGSPITATGYSSTNLTSSTLVSDFAYANIGYTAPTTLNLEAMTFKYADTDY